MSTKLEMLKGYLDDQGEEPLIELKTEWLRELVQEVEEEIGPVEIIDGTTVRLSIPGDLCTNCGTKMGESLVCPGCGWVDPMTKRERS